MAAFSKVPPLGQNGSTLIEFSMIAPILMLLMMGTIELSLIMYANSIMEGAAFDASRRGKTGYVDQDVTREDTILNTLYERTEDLLDTSQISITTTTYNQFDQIGQPEPFVDANGNGERDSGENYTDVNGNGQYDTDVGIAGAGSASQVVVYTINYPWPIFTPLVGDLLGLDGVVNLTARAIVQNEPF